MLRQSIKDAFIAFLCLLLFGLILSIKTSENAVSMGPTRYGVIQIFFQTNGISTNKGPHLR
jgi:hypothetical protein